ncbi:MAG TPA: PAS domain-containing protein [Candidatus Cybelea sp.]|nr:PAS domain-containing protein [Candidatus Cybelea sp.]
MSSYDESEFVTDPGLALREPALQSLLALWNAKRGAKAMPARADFDVADLRPHLGHLVLVDVLRPEMRFRYRLIGVEVTRRVGRDSTGKYLDELYAPEQYDRVIVAYRWVTQQCRPIRVEATLRHAHREWMRIESLDLPLSRDGESVDMIMSRPVFL